MNGVSPSSKPEREQGLELTSLTSMPSSGSVNNVPPSDPVASTPPRNLEAGTGQPTSGGYLFLGILFTIIGALAATVMVNMLKARDAQTDVKTDAATTNAAAHSNAFNHTAMVGSGIGAGICGLTVCMCAIKGYNAYKKEKVPQVDPNQSARVQEATDLHLTSTIQKALG